MVLIQYEGRPNEYMGNSRDSDEPFLQHILCIHSTAFLTVRATDTEIAVRNGGKYANFVTNMLT